MEDYKKEFVDFLLLAGALKLGGDFTLKSGRLSPWFVNIGDFNDGESTSRLATAYARAIQKGGCEFDLLYGIPEKGVALAIAASIELGRLGVCKPWFFTRKIPKEHGETSAANLPEGANKRVVGRAPQDGQRIMQLDDVFTAGNTKYEARETLKGLGNFELPYLVIAVDREEVGSGSVSAIEKYEKDTGTKVLSIVGASEILQYLQSRPDVDRRALERMATYLRVYGTKLARDIAGKGLEQKIIEADRSVIPACDVETLEQFENLVKQTQDIEGIGGYKVGFELGLGYGLPRVVEAARKHTAKPIIYDHQKGGTDIPDTGKKFARVCKKAGVDAVIFFPQSGPETERSFIYHALDQGLKVIVGGRMTHPAYAVSEGGWITDQGALEMYSVAARAGVNHFVVPGNKPEIIQQVKDISSDENVSPVFYAPGFVAQGGKIAEAAKVAGVRWHAIVGRGIYEAPDVRKAAQEHTREIVGGPSLL